MQVCACSQLRLAGATLPGRLPRMYVFTYIIDVAGQHPQTKPGRVTSWTLWREKVARRGERGGGVGRRQGRADDDCAAGRRTGNGERKSKKILECGEIPYSYCSHSDKTECLGNNRL